MGWGDAYFHISADIVGGPVSYFYDCAYIYTIRTATGELDRL